MIGAEDDLEGGEDNKSGESLKPRKKKKRTIRDYDEVGSLRDIMIAGELQRCMTATAEDMKVGDPVSASRAGFRNGGESEELWFRSHLYGLKILQGKNVSYDSLWFWFTGKNDLTRRATHREAVFGPVIHSIFDTWHYEVLWTCNLTRLL